MIFSILHYRPANSNSLLNSNQSQSPNDETITLHAAPPQGHDGSASPPQQVIRQMVVTDKQAGQPQQQGQLQLPQRPTPPTSGASGQNVPKPTTAKVS